MSETNAGLHRRRRIINLMRQVSDLRQIALDAYGIRKGNGIVKLAFAILRYYPFGGLEKSFLNICKEAIRRSHELTIYCSRWQGDKLSGTIIHELPVKSLTNHGKLQHFHNLLMKSYGQGKYDALVGFKRMPDLDVYYNGDACFVLDAENKHGPWFRLTPRYRAMAKMEQAVFGQTGNTHILYIAEQEKDNYQRIYGTCDARFHALPAGIDKGAIRSAVETGKRDRIRASHSVASDEIVLMMVGSDFYRKGVDRGIDAVAALPESLKRQARLWVVGTGNVNRYEKQARQSGISDNITFWGGRNDVPDLLAAADILLHPARVETAGNAILEGMVAGLPVIVSAGAGFGAHVAAGKGGILIEDQPYRQSCLDKAVFDLVAGPELRRAFGRNGWDYADDTDLYHRPQVAMDVIEMIVGARQHRVSP